MQTKRGISILTLLATVILLLTFKKGMNFFFYLIIFEHPAKKQKQKDLFKLFAENIVVILKNPPNLYFSGVSCAVGS